MKKNPMYDFGIKYPTKMLISKEHLIDMYGKDTPGAGSYKPLVHNTFDEIKAKADIVK